jgi:hypothetical protein
MIINFRNDIEYSMCVLVLIGVSLFVVLSCSSVFAGETIVLLGTSPLCVWDAPSSILVTLGRSYSLSIGSPIIVNSGSISLIRSADGLSALIPQQQVALLAPDHPVQVIIVLSGPTVIGPCDSATLSARASYGFSGRPMTYIWSIDPTLNPTLRPSSLSTIQGFLQNQGSQDVISIPNLLFDSVTYNYTISINVSNWLSSGSYSTWTFHVNALPPPGVFLSSYSSRVFPESTLSVIASASSPDISCLSSSATIAQFTYRWHQTLGAPLGDLESQGVRDQFSTLSFPAYFFPPGQYAFQVEVSCTIPGLSNAVSTNTASTDVYISLSNLVPIIYPGSSMQSLTNRTLALDARASYDPSLAPALRSNSVFSFTWACETVATIETVATVETVAGLCWSQPPESASNAILTFDTANVDISLTYIFTLSVRDSSRSASAQAFFTFASLPVPFVSIAQFGSNVNRDDMVQLEAVVMAPSGFGNLPTPYLTWTSDLLDLSNREIWLSPMNCPNLVLKPGVLLAGVRYTFTVQANFSVAGLAVGSGSLSFETNLPPSGGSCVVESGANVTLGTSASIICTDWSDDPQDLPLQYMFGYYNGRGELIYLTESYQSNPYTFAFLPLGEVSVVIRIRDRKLGIREDFLLTNVVMSPAGNVDALFLSVANESLATGSLGTFSQVAGALMSMPMSPDQSIAFQEIMFSMLTSFTANGIIVASQDSAFAMLSIAGLLFQTPNISESIISSGLEFVGNQLHSLLGFGPIPVESAGGMISTLGSLVEASVGTFGDIANKTNSTAAQAIQNAGIVVRSLDNVALGLAGYMVPFQEPLICMSGSLELQAQVTQDISQVAMTSNTGSSMQINSPGSVGSSTGAIVQPLVRVCCGVFCVFLSAVLFVVLMIVCLVSFLTSP